MDTSTLTLRQHLERVQACHQAAVDEGLMPWLSAVRQVQVQRFRYTYADLLASPAHREATTFFLEELYGSDNYAQRDAQFARIASALERLFPPSVLSLALQLAHVHALTESLDLALARAWAQVRPTPPTMFTPAGLAVCAADYVAAWQSLGHRDERGSQLTGVVDMGHQLTHVVRIPGLRTALKLMRRPARAAGLDLLQRVLEGGFDAFRSLQDPSAFLDVIGAREAAWMSTLFDRPGDAQHTLRCCLTPTPSR
ncbi:FFLEELY motif protein [Hydrogenophaga soli]